MKRSEVIPAAVAVLKAAFPALSVVANDFSRAASLEMETALRSASGVCIVVNPIMGTTRLDQARMRSAERADVSIRIRVNRALAPLFDAYAATDSIIDAVLADRPLRADLDQAATDLTQDDEGVLSYAINFTVTIN